MEMRKLRVMINDEREGKEWGDMNRKEKKWREMNRIIGNHSEGMEMKGNRGKWLCNEKNWDEMKGDERKG